VYAETGSILDSDADSTTQDIQSSGLKLNAAIGVGVLGASVNAIETTVTTLSARATSGGINVLEANELIVDDVTVTVQNVALDATSVNLDGVAQSDVVTTAGNGSIVLRATAGRITLKDSSSGILAGLTNLIGKAVSANGSGNILLEAIGAGTDIIVKANADIVSGSGNITLLAARTIDLQANIDVTTTGIGTLEIGATTGSFTMAASATLNSFDGDIRIHAGDDLTDQLTIGLINATNANVSLLSSGSILDSDTAGDTNRDIFALGLRIEAGKGFGLLSGNSLGQAVNAIETKVTSLSASIKGSDGLNLIDEDGLIITDITSPKASAAGEAVTVNLVQSDATTVIMTDAKQSDIRTTGINGSNGSIVIRTTAGSITIEDGTTPANSGVNGNGGVSTNGSGNILLEAIGAGTDIIVKTDADIVSGSGNITLLAARTIDLQTNVDVTTTGIGTLEIGATTGSFTMATSATLNSVDGDIRIHAGDDILDQLTIGLINATNANVSLLSSGSILDSDTAGDTNRDIFALGLRIEAGKGFGLLSGNSLGQAVNAIETKVTSLSALIKGSDGLNLIDEDGLIIMDIISPKASAAGEAVTLNLVQSDATTVIRTDAKQSDIRTTSTNGSNGSIVIRTTAGSVTLNDGTALADDTAISANGSGNILIQALAAGTDITVNADVMSTSGNISVLAARSVIFTYTSDIRTSSTSASSGSIDIVAGTGAITQSATSLFLSSGVTATARLLAATSITVGDIELSGGKVSLTATSGSILDADALIGVKSDTNDADQDITSSALRLNAGTAIGESVNHLETTVGTLSTRAANGGIYLLEADTLIVDDVMLSVNRVSSDASTTTTNSTDALQSDIRTTGGNGNIVLRTTAGSITLQDGTSFADNIAVSTDGSGNILIQSLGAGGDITANADVISTMGSVSILGSGGVSFTSQADIRSQGTGSVGSIDVVSGSGLVRQAVDSLFASTNGAIRVVAATTIEVGDISTSATATVGTGVVSLIATTGSIVDADVVMTTNDANLNITAAALRLNAGVGAGQSINHLETQVDVVSARATSGGIYLLESDGVTVGDVTVTVSRVKSDGEVSGSLVTDALQCDLITYSHNGSIVLTSTTGSIILDDGTAVAGSVGVAVSANGSGNILIQTLATDGAITASADVMSNTGSISVLGGGSVNFMSLADILTQGSGSVGSIDVVSGSGSVIQAADSLFASMNGTIRVLAETTIQVGDINTSATVTPGTGIVSLIATTGSIIDADAVTTTNDTQLNITAFALRMSASVGVGESINHLETTVGTVSARATSGGIYLLESDSVTVGDVAVMVNRVKSDGTVIGSTVTDALQSDLVTTSGNGNIVLTSTTGTIVLDDGTALADNTAISANGTGNVLLQTLGTTGDITANADIVTTAVGGTLGSGTGSVSILSGHSVTLTTNADIRTEGACSVGTIDVVAANSGSVIMSSNSVFASMNGALRVLAAADIQVGVIRTAATAVAGNGVVSLTATTGNMVDAQNLGNTSNSDAIVNIIASALRLNAGTGIGQSINHLETMVGTVSSRATSGGIYLLESDNVTVGDVTVMVNRVKSDGTVTDVKQSDLMTRSGNGSIVLTSTTGSIILDDGTASADNTAISTNGSGNILVQTLAATGDITANADIVTTATGGTLGNGTGNVSILSGHSVTFNSLADIRTQGDGSMGTIDVVAANGGSVIMSANSVFASTNGTIRVLAATDIQLGVIGTVATAGAGTGMVSLTAISGSILDAQNLGNLDNSDSIVNVTAAGLLMNAGIGIGQGINHLETTVDTVTGRATSGGVYLLESDGLAVGDVTVIVNRVKGDGTVSGSTVTDAQSDLVTTSGNGSIVLTSTTGSIILSDGTASADNMAISVNGSGNILVQTLSTTGDITANADIVTTASAGVLGSGLGNISLLSGYSVTFATNADILTEGGSSVGTIDVVAANSGSVIMSANSVFGSTNGAIRVLAASSIEVGVIRTAATAVANDGSGMVSLTATSGSIVDAQNLGNLSNSDATVNVTASGLRLNAGTGIGQSINHLETMVAVVSARATSGGISLLESDGVTVGDVTVMVNRVLSDGTVTASTVTDIKQSDLVTTSGNGSIVLTSTTGSIILGDGTASADNTAISTNGAGNVLVQTLSATGDITANADIVTTASAGVLGSGLGNISLLSGHSITFTTNADILTEGASSVGTIDVVAANSGSVIMSANSVFGSTNGAIRVLAANSIEVGVIRTAATATANDGSGMVSLTATTGSIVDSQNLGNANNSDAIVNVTASGLRLNAGIGIGQSINHLETTVGTVSGRATSGGIYLLENDGVTVGDVTVKVNRVLSDGTVTNSTVTDTRQSDLATTSGNGSIVLTSATGSIILGDGTASADNTSVSANGSGNILVQTLSATGDITVEADIVTMAILGASGSGTGSISLRSGHNVTFTLNADIRTDGTSSAGTIDVVAANSGSVIMSANSVFGSTNGAIRVLAANSIEVGVIRTAATTVANDGSGMVSLTATTGSIVDAQNLGSLSNSDAIVNVIASALRLNAGTGIGQSINHLETAVVTVSARATSGGMYLLESDSLTVGDVTVMVTRVKSDGTVTGSTVTDVLQSDLVTTAGNGSIVLTSTTGSIVLSDGTALTDNTAISANGAGNVLVQTLSTTGDVTANADVVTTATAGVLGSGAGSVSILSGHSVIFSSLSDIRTQGIGSASTIDVVASNGGSVIMAADTLFASSNGAIRVLAAAEIQVGVISTAATAAAGTGMVSLTATSGSIVDAQNLGNLNNSDAIVNVTASSLRLNAGTGIGQSVNHLEAMVAVVSARATSGGIYLLESDGVTVGDVTVMVNRVLSDGTVTASTVTDLKQSDLVTTSGNGSIVLTSTTGSIILGDGTASADNTAISVNGSGNILVQTLSATGDITANADIVTTASAGVLGSGIGHISLLSCHSVTFATNADIRTEGASSTGTIDVVAANSGSVIMSANSVFGSTNGAIRVLAANSIEVGVIRTAATAVANDGSGMVSLTATSGSIVDAQNLGNLSNSDAIVNVTASGLRLNAGTGIGQSINHLETTVAVVSARVASGGVYLLESDNVTVGDVTVMVNRVLSDGTVTTSTVTDIKQSDLVTTSGNGNIVLSTTNGTITLTDGSDGNNSVISSNGSGNILVDASGVGSDIILSADITSKTGHITLKAADAITLGSGADVTAGSSGTISLDAKGGALTMDGTSTITATGSSLRLNAAAELIVGNLTAMNVSLVSDTGAIINAAGSTMNVTATNLRLQSDDAIGAPGSHLTITVDTLSANSTGTDTASMYLAEVGDITVSNVEVSVTDVNRDATTTVLTDNSQADLVTGNNGNIVLVTLNGSITLSDGVTASGINGYAVSANGSGSILLAANGIGSAITVTADILSGSGHITLGAGENLILGSGVDVVTAAPGTISLDARTGALLMDGTANVTATGSSLRLNAATDVTVGNLAADSVSIVSPGGAIINAVGSTINVTATNLRLQAYGSIGTPEHPFTTDVVYLSADPVIEKAGIYLREKNSVIISGVEVKVKIFTPDAKTAEITDLLLSDLVTGKNGSIELITIDGSITLNDGDGNGSAINANGTGSIVLQAHGAGGSITINSTIETGSGIVSIVASKDVFQNADIKSSGNTVLVEASKGSIVMDQGVQTVNKSGVIQYNSYNDVLLALLHAESGSVQVSATTGSISSTGELNVQAEHALFKAGVNIGVRNSKPLSLSVDRVAAEAVTGGLAIVNDRTILVTPLGGVNGLAANDGISLESLTGDIIVAAPVDTKGHSDALLSFPEGILQGSKAYFDDAGSYLKVRNKQFQYLWDLEQSIYTPSITSPVFYRQPDAVVQSSQWLLPVKPVHNLLEVSTVAELEQRTTTDAYVQMKEGYLFFHWGEVAGADSYLLVVERDKLEFASRWLEDISWAPFERFPEGIYEWSLYSWASDGLKLVYGPMHFKI